MNNLKLFLVALPAVAAFGFTVYFSHTHEGKSKEHAIRSGWTYGILAMGVFILIYLIKFTSISN